MRSARCRGPQARKKAVANRSRKLSPQRVYKGAAEVLGPQYPSLEGGGVGLRTAPPRRCSSDHRQKGRCVQELDHAEPDPNWVAPSPYRELQTQSLFDGCLVILVTSESGRKASGYREGPSGPGKSAPDKVGWAKFMTWPAGPLNRRLCR